MHSVSQRLKRPGLIMLGLFISIAAQAEVDDGRYTIVSRHSGLALAVEGNSRTDGANVIQSNVSGATSQQFDVSSLGNGYYSIRPVHSGKSLDVYEFSTEPGGDIRQWTYTGGYNQQWAIKKVDDRHQKIISRHSGLALDVWEWSTRSGGDIRQWSDTGAANQQWEFRPVGDTGGGDSPGATACLSSPPGFAAQGNGTTGGTGGQEVTVRVGDLGIIQKVRHIYHPLLRQGMILIQQNHILIVFQQLELQIGIGCNLREILAVFLTEADHTQFCLTAGQQFQGFLGMGFPNHCIDSLGLDQRYQILADHMERRGRVGNAYTQAVAFRQAGTHSFNGIHFTQNIVGMLQKCHASLCGTDTLMGTVKDCESNRFFHFPQNTA